MSDWELLPIFLLRSAGFSFDLLRSLHFDRTLKQVAVIRAHQRGLEELTSRIWHQVHDLVALESDPKRRSRLLELRKQVFKTRVDWVWAAVEAPRPEGAEPDLPEALRALLCDWLAAQRRGDALAQRGQAVLEAELAEKRGALVELARRPDFQEALFLSNPNLYPDRLKAFLATWEPGRRPSKTRSFELKLVMYLQRFCAKNETTSFFGPVALGRCQPGGKRNIDFSIAPVEKTTRCRTVARREVLFAHWGAARLAEAMSRDPQLWPFLRPRRNGAASLGDGVLHFHMLGRALPLGPLDQEILARCDGARSIDEILASFPAPLGEQVGGRIAQLQRAGVLTGGLEIPSDTYYPLQVLLEETRRLPARCASRGEWLARLKALERMRAAFVEADLARRPGLLAELEEAFCTAAGEGASSGARARRGAGEHYRDRTLIYEECRRNFEDLALGGVLLGRIEQSLQRTLDWDAYRGLLESRSAQRLAAALIDDEAAPVPYGEFVRRCLTVELQGDEAGAARLLEQRLVEAVDAARQAGPMDVSACLAEVPRHELDGSVLFAAVDVLISSRSLAAINAGDFELVIGEIQPIIGTWGYSALFCDDKEALRREVADRIAAGGCRDELASIVISHESKIKGYELPGTSIEFLARSAKERSQVVACSDLSVVLDEGTPKLRALSSGRTYRLYGGISDSLEEASLSMPRVRHRPIARPPHTPRIVADGIVTQRERWVLPAAALRASLDPSSPLALMLSAARLREDRGFPWCIFVKIPEETKPIAIDFRSFLFVELFADVIDRCRGEVQITEMFPDENGLWLQDDAGRYTSELRLTFFRTRRGEST